MFNEMDITLDTRCPGRTHKAGQGVGLSHEQPSKRLYLSGGERHKSLAQQPFILDCAIGKKMKMKRTSY